MDTQNKIAAIFILLILFVGCKQKPCECKSFYVDVTWFGAVGDGKHNDLQAVQSAINAIVANGGGVIPSGIYLVDSIKLNSVDTIILTDSKDTIYFDRNN